MEYPSFYEMAVLWNNTHIGAVSLYLDKTGKDAEFGWMINKKYHGRGFATEAAKALMKYAKENLGVEHFIATCDTENAASKSVMEKLGMILIEERGGRHNKQFSEERREYLFKLGREDSFLWRRV